MKTKILLILFLMPALLVTGCFQTALVAVSVVNAVDSVTDMVERHDERKERVQNARPAGKWQGQNISDLFVAWGQPSQIHQPGQSNQFGGRSYVWAKTCGPANESIENRTSNTGKCQVLVQADGAGKIRDMNPGIECAPCEGLLN